MSAKKVGTLIKKARTEAGMTQEQLARKVKDCTASDISRAERGEKALTNEQLKAIAKATGVTQKSLLDAAGSSGKTSSSSSSKPGSKTTSMKLTAAEKKLVELYRAADKESKEAAIKALKGDSNSILGELLEEFIENIVKK